MLVADRTAKLSRRGTELTQCEVGQSSLYVAICSIADALGMEVGPPESLSLAEEMPKHEAEWAAIVRKYNLRAPTRLLEITANGKPERQKR